MVRRARADFVKEFCRHRSCWKSPDNIQMGFPTVKEIASDTFLHT